MLTDEQLIDGLRSELEALRPPADLIEHLREQAADKQHRGMDRTDRIGDARGRWTPAAVLPSASRHWRPAACSCSRSARSFSSLITTRSVR